MTDAEKREKVIRGLERFINDYERYITDWKPVTDALDLLKEREGVKPIGGYGCYICGVCKNPLTSVSQKFCSVCGKAVKWDD